MENGTQLGPYEIVERLGAGGMGEVYRARDRRLGREVAIKILPAAVARDPQRLARFQEEARLLASVNHANIAAIHELDNAEGVEFFAQELVPGESLARRLASGPLEIDEALVVGRQIAAALEVAHDNGLVHRDLKPSNVMLTPDLQVKVLDFGLAMPVSRSSEDIENTETQEIPAFASDDTPTVSVDTAPTAVTSGPRGTGIEGTPPYMSPEQARGRPVDRRADIWSAGCVLYEMLSGRRCFSGETALDTLAAVVRAEPEWGLLPRGTPAALRALIRRMLRKDPTRRLQHIGDARVRLTEISEGFEEERIVMDAGDAGTPVGAGVGWAAALLMIGGFTGAIVQGALFDRRPAAPAEPVMAAITLPLGQRVVTDPVASLALSPDGRFLVYGAGTSEGSQLYLRRSDRFAPEPLPGTAGASGPFFSPDSRWLAYFSSDGKLMKLPLDGGASQRICDVPVGNAGATWGNGRIIFGTAFTGSGLLSVPDGGGEPQLITRPEAERNEIQHGWPVLLPDGNTLLFAARDSRNRSSIYAMSLSRRERRLLLEDVTDVRYLTSSQLLFVQGSGLRAVAFDVDRLALAGSPIHLLDGISSSVAGARANFAASDTGELVFLPGEATQGRQRLVWVNRSGQVEPLPFESATYGHPQLSPDGTRLAVDQDSNGAIRVLDLVRGTESVLRVPGYSLMPVWNPSGSRILMASSVDGPAALYTMRADGAPGDTPQLLLRRDAALWPRSWSSTGIAFYELNPDPEKGRDIYLLAADAEEARPLVASRHNERSPMISPDGRWLAYVSNESTRDEVYVRALIDGDDRRWPISVHGGREPVWSASGDELFYRAGDAMMAVTVTPTEPPTYGLPQQVFVGSFAVDRTAYNQYYDVAADGRFLMIQEEQDNRVGDHLHVVLNFDRLVEEATDEAEAERRRQ